MIWVTWIRHLYEKLKGDNIKVNWYTTSFNNWNWYYKNWMCLDMCQRVRYVRNSVENTASFQEMCHVCMFPILFLSYFLVKKPPIFCIVKLTWNFQFKTYLLLQLTWITSYHIAWLFSSIQTHHCPVWRLRWKMTLYLSLLSSSPCI